MSLTLAFSKKQAASMLGAGSHPIAIVSGGEAGGAKLWLAPDAKSPDAITRIDLPTDEHFQLEPTNDPDGRDLAWVFGASGSGKSHILRAFAMRYRTLWPRRPIVLISQLQEDETLDAVADRIGIRRLNVQTLVDKPLEIAEVRDTLVLVDDVEAMPKDCAEAVHRTAELVATQGRHTHTSMLYSTHSSTMGLKSRVLLSEMHSYVCFAHGCSFASLKYLLERYAGLDAEQIKAARRLQSRWFCISKRYPPLIIADGSAYILNSTE